LYSAAVSASDEEGAAVTGVMPVLVSEQDTKTAAERRNARNPHRKFLDILHLSI
jgi:hypothetical protein